MYLYVNYVNGSNYLGIAFAETNRFTIVTHDPNAMVFANLNYHFHLLGTQSGYFPCYDPQHRLGPSEW